MSCQSCKEHWFWKKLGRCQRCMIQLFILSIIGWGCWWLFADSINAINRIAMLFANLAFSGLLALHLVMWAFYQMKKG